MPQAAVGIPMKNNVDGASSRHRVATIFATNLACTSLALVLLSGAAQAQLIAHPAKPEANAATTPSAQEDQIGERDVNHVALAELALQRGKSSEAIRHYYRSLRLNPQQPEISEEIVALLIGQQRFREAKRVVADALKLSPNQYKLWLHQARIHERLGELSLAALSYDSAVTLGTEDTSVLIAAASFYRGQGDSDYAATLIERATTLDVAQQPVSQGQDTSNVAENAGE